MARVNYGFEKRQKEIAKQKKKEAKKKKKLERSAVKENGETAQVEEAGAEVETQTEAGEEA